MYYWLSIAISYLPMVLYVKGTPLIFPQVHPYSLAY